MAAAEIHVPHVDGDVPEWCAGTQEHTDFVEHAVTDRQELDGVLARRLHERSVNVSEGMHDGVANVIAIDSRRDGSDVGRKHLGEEGLPRPQVGAIGRTPKALVEMDVPISVVAALEIREQEPEHRTQNVLERVVRFEALRIVERKALEPAGRELVLVPPIQNPVFLSAKRPQCGPHVLGIGVSGRRHA